MHLSVRNLSALALAKLLIMLGAVRSSKKKALNGAYILPIFFHDPSKEEFETCIKWFKKNNFHFLSICDLEKIMEGTMPFPKGGVLLTLDDGWHSNEENVIQVANKHEVPVTIFVSTEPVENGSFWWSLIPEEGCKVTNTNWSVEALKRIPNKQRVTIVENIKGKVSLQREALTVDQVGKAARSRFVTIGGHTHTHPVLITCEDEEVRSEVVTCKQKLEAWTGKNITAFAYPNGDFSFREIHALKESNYKLAFSIKQQYLTPDWLERRYELPRFCFLEGASFSENICRMTGVWKFTRVWISEHLLKRTGLSNLFPFYYFKGLVNF